MLGLTILERFLASKSFPLPAEQTFGDSFTVTRIMATQVHIPAILRTGSKQVLGFGTSPEGQFSPLCSRGL